MNFLSLFKRKLIYQFKKKIPIDKDHFPNYTLDELFHHYGSDKANIFKGKNSKGHGFSNFYSLNLKELKDKQINILEIGSFAGSSAAAFSKYFSNSKIFCFDINISNFKYESKKIFVYGLNINNRQKADKTLKNIFKNYNFDKFDLIIDDGSHLLSDITKSLNYFFKHLKNLGTYVIEDFKHPNYYKYNKDVNEILVDEILNNLSKKQYFNSSFLNKDDQNYLMKSIKNINIFKGNLKDSDICFIKKN